MRKILPYLLMMLLAPALALADPPGLHGMLVVGTGSVYLSHLPMFHSPHDYQVILEVDLGSATANYVKDRETHPSEKVYTIMPETFVLPEMVQAPRPFQAQLFRGHFERGGKVIAKAVTITIRKVVHFRKLDANSPRPSQLRYLIFGKPGEAFLAHLISARPDFDHLLSAVIPEGSPLLPLLSSRGALSVEVEQAVADKPLGAGDGVKVRAPGRAGASGTLSAREIYVEFGDLT
jgi:hypothetical protein